LTDRVWAIAPGGDGFLPVLENYIDLKKRARYEDRPVHKTVFGLVKCMRD
jgi:hypothetical protein